MAQLLGQLRGATAALNDRLADLASPFGQLHDRRYLVRTAAVHEDSPFLIDHTDLNAPLVIVEADVDRYPPMFHACSVHINP